MRTTFSLLPLAGEGPGMRAVGSAPRGASRHTRPHRNPLPKGEGIREGFSLLEVILALAILGVSMAVLGEVARLATRNAAYARDMAQAQLLCESKMAEIAAGIAWPEPVAGARIAPEDLVDPADPVPWVYSIRTASVEEPGVIRVEVTVSQDLPPARRPAACMLVRWIADPGIELSEPPEAEESPATSSGTSSESSQPSTEGDGNG